MQIINELSKQLWNIGFCESTPEEVVQNKRLPIVKWMKHKYRDRWFADPFIYHVTNKTIIVFVEEYNYSTNKGTLCELEIDRKTMILCNRRELLSLNTHLSYPIWLRHEGKVYLYPENGESGRLTMYEYDEQNHCLISPNVILEDAVADASIVKVGALYYLVATRYPITQENLYLYKSDSFSGPFSMCSDKPVQTGCSKSRQGGMWFNIGEQLYRPAQNCQGGYGRYITIMHTTINGDVFKESAIVIIKPNTFKYNLGLHTINFHDGLCVIDAHGYNYPVAGRILDSIRRIRRRGK